MCGIGCVVRARGLQDKIRWQLCECGEVSLPALRDAVRRRGPDAWFVLEEHLNEEFSVTAMGAVLALRGGGQVVRQPSICNEQCPTHDLSPRVLSSCPSFLQWNGEVFGGGLRLSSSDSDTLAIRDRLRRLECECSLKLVGVRGAGNKHCEERLDDARSCFAKLCVKFFETEIEGPYAFVYYAGSLELLLFGRDPLGRRSLLTHVASSSSSPAEADNVAVEFAISSVAVEHFDSSATVDITPTRKKRFRHVTYEENGSDNDIDSVGECSLFSLGCWKELPNTGLFTFETKVSLSPKPYLTHYPWQLSHGMHPLLRAPYSDELHLPNTKVEEHPDKLMHLLCKREALSHPLIQQSTEFDLMAATGYLRALWKAVTVRVQPSCCGGDETTPVGVLFSGGIDCTVLAAIAHYVLPAVTPIELINVAFGDTPGLTPDRLATFSAVEQLLQLVDPSLNEEAGCSPVSSAQPQREWRLVLVDVSTESDDTHIRNLIFPKGDAIDISIGTALWHAAQGRGRMQRIRHGNHHAREERPCKHKLCRLSAGDADSSDDQGTPTTYDADDSLSKFSPLVDALVEELEAFGGGCPTAPVLLSTLGKDYMLKLRPVITRCGYKKLGRYVKDAEMAGVITFVKQNEAPSKAIRLARPEDLERVRRVQPADWLQISNETSPISTHVENYKCEARVLLLGMGADETLGGYTRHRRAFERRGIRGLAKELNHDFARLWERNLGRDDRVVSDSGREGRYPYLDEGVLAALAAIVLKAQKEKTCGEGATTIAEETSGMNSVGERDDAVLEQAIGSVCCFTAAAGVPGVGDKKILRRCAALLGLGDVVRLQKRAIQFGSRAAHPVSWQRVIPLTAALKHG
uniref:Glutamine amidotransferase type-2 domain-containing protein n=1 Tax=Trypanosoma congolense (strain IL3000) TaxID=1068625 RepID=G0UKD2_TRYCI|nr:conserved hypothetical protein [Trypanosoma congolense IL3000]